MVFDLDLLAHEPVPLSRPPSSFVRRLVPIILCLASCRFLTCLSFMISFSFDFVFSLEVYGFFGPADRLRSSHLELPSDSSCRSLRVYHL